MQLMQSAVVINFFVKYFLKQLAVYWPSSVLSKRPTKAMLIADEDALLARSLEKSLFLRGTKPVIRWIKGDGLDDVVTRAAIGQATRIFGSEVDYCLCTQGLDAERVRHILECADQPVEWYPIDATDNPKLASYLMNAGCKPENFGYWWKWFPERVRLNAPEWLLDGDMVITAKPKWYADWVKGNDVLRVTQDDRWPAEGMYGDYVSEVNLELKLYSGLISFPPGLTYMPSISKVLANKPLKYGHHGQRDMCEQGIIAAAMQKLDALPIPLYEFPFGRAFENHIDYGLAGDQNAGWGFHFGHAFKTNNKHFERLTSEGVIFSMKTPNLIEKFKWLGGTDQWGIPGWSIPDDCLMTIIDVAKNYVGKKVLELGSSRGRVAATLASLGCIVTTVDHQDRGARLNLLGMGVNVIHDDALEFLINSSDTYDLIVCDLHGNSNAEWQRYAQPILTKLNQKGVLILNNLNLHKSNEWREESGVSWFVNQLPKVFKIKKITKTFPGIVIIESP